MTSATIRKFQMDQLRSTAIAHARLDSITAVPAVHAMHPNRPGTVLGANASGKVMRFAVVEDE